MNRRDFLAAVGGTWLIGRGLRWPGGTRVDGTGAGASDAFVERWSWAMGQPVRLQLFAPSETEGYAAAQAALAELRRVEAALSRFDDASDLSELNRRAGRGPLRVGPDLAVVLAASVRLRRATSGAFDPAVEPLMRAWGFVAPRAAEPTAGELAEARAAVRASAIVVEGDRVALRGSATRLDLGGIGVGHGLDRAGAVLRAAGIRRAFLDVSGDCLAIGAPPGEEGWLVEVADPARPGGTVASTRLCDAALATSSNQLSVVRYGRAIRGHVIDPASGWPATGCTQVSVVARSGTEADALSTAMLVSPRPFRGVLRAYTV
jgi:thiamine biosynthesis lipoprotein